jgi:ubiquinone/menaquinone biosynthesis C-methylase UbiE
MTEIHTTNFQKFKTNNLLMKFLFKKFFYTVGHLIAGKGYKKALDAGCGEGETIFRLKKILPEKIEGFDSNPECIDFVTSIFPQHKFTVQNIYELPYHDDSYDLVFCCEVLEHLESPQMALAELKRISGRSVILTVPHEPWFQLGNFFRGKYFSTWGNHPEHIQHWNPASFCKLLSEVFPHVEICCSFPWIIAHCKTKAGPCPQDYSEPRISGKE